MSRSPSRFYDGRFRGRFCYRFRGRQSLRPWPTVVAVLMVLFIALAARETRAAPNGGKMVLAVLYFDNNTGDRTYDVLQKGLADMMITDLTAAGLDVVERDKLEALLKELRLQRTRYFDPKTAQKLGRGIGARFAVTGAIAAIEPEIRLDIRLVEVESARIVMADKVVGKKDAFFDLQSKLVGKFVRGLDVRAKATSTAATGLVDVATLLQYSQAVDSADRDDLETASQKLGSLVRSAPRFTLAKKRYAEVIRRLRLAKKRRQAGLGADERILMDNIERELKKPISGLKGDDANHYFGYLVARGNMHLWRARNIAALSKGQSGPVWVKKAQHRAWQGELRGFFANTERFITDMRAYRAQQISQGKRRPDSIDTAVRDDDRRRGRELGVADDIGDWTFASPPRVARALADFTVTGMSPFWLEIERFTARPTLVDLDAGYGDKSLAMLLRAREELPKYEEGEGLQNAMAENIDTYAEVLLRLGRRDEAIAEWQSFLDQYPKATQYRAFEQKIEGILGISDKAQAFEKALSTCSTEIYAQMYEEAKRVARADGANGLRTMMKNIETTCGRGTMGPSFTSQAYYFAAREASELGNCDLFREVEAKVQALGPAFVQQLAQLPSPCL